MGLGCSSSNGLKVCRYGLNPSISPPQFEVDDIPTALADETCAMPSPDLGFCVLAVMFI